MGKIKGKTQPFIDTREGKIFFHRKMKEKFGARMGRGYNGGNREIIQLRLLHE